MSQDLRAAALYDDMGRRSQMADTDAINAYLEGRISRRTLVRRLVAAGVSLGAAASYSQLLDPAFARTHGSWGPKAFHLFARTQIVQERLGHVVHKKRLLIKVESHRNLESAGAQVRLHRPGNAFPDSLIGVHSFSLKGPHAKTIAVPLDYNPPHSVDALKGLKTAKLSLLVFGLTDKVVNGIQGNGPYAYMSDTATLKR